jgi:hypothetical protein
VGGEQVAPEARSIPKRRSLRSRPSTRRR